MVLYHLAVACAVFNMVSIEGHLLHQHPYAFGYSVKDHFGEQHREESGIGGLSVKGSYGFKDDRGVHRLVDYVADKMGFQAKVKTNEPGTANIDSAAVKIHSSAHPYFGNPSVRGGFGGHKNGYVGLGGHGHGLGGFGGHSYGHGIGFAGVRKRGNGHAYGYGYEKMFKLSI